MFGRKEVRVYTDSVSEKQLRVLGDTARDAHEWDTAVAYYDAYLQAVPNDFAIWVQKGNCAKEARQIDAALSAYDRAILLNDEDADVFLQRGHALKLAGWRSEAIRSYKRALTINPDMSAAIRELNALGIFFNEIQTRHRYLRIDITDLLFYLRAHLNVSGIQRVIVSFVRAAYQERRAEPFSSVSFVTVDWASRRVMDIDIDDVMTVVNVVSSAHKTRAELDRAIDACTSSNRGVIFKKGDVYFIIGAFWVSPSYESVLLDLKETGVTVGVYIYDLIPVMHRKFVTRELAEGFTKNLYELTSLCDFALAISEFVAGEFRDFVSKNFNREIPVAAVTLAHEIDSYDDIGGDVSQHTLDLTQDNYVLCVGTIEIRKNHQYLINAWRRLIDEQVEPPNLIIVGRWGWRVQDLKEQLEESDYLQGRVIILPSVSDPDLAHFYKNCEFSVFPSFVEGWGLPVGESLAFGRPCVASKSSSIPEVGGDFVRYLDPDDLNSGLAIFRELFADSAKLKIWSDRIKSEFKPVSWSDVARKLCVELDRQSRMERSIGKLAYFEAQPGMIVPIGTDLRGSFLRNDLSMASASLVRVKGWHPIEPWGCWSRSRTSWLRFGTSLPDGARVTVGIKVKFPLSAQATVRVTSGTDVQTVLGNISSRPTWRFIPAIAQKGVVEIVFHCVGDIVVPSPEKRSLYLGLEAFAYAAQDEMEERFALVQNIITFEGTGTMESLVQRTSV